VTRNGTVSDYATNLLNFDPTGPFPGSGEKGLTGIVVDPATGDVFASLLYQAADTKHYPKVVRFHSNNGGLTMATQAPVLTMANEEQGASHQISNLSIGPDNKLYVHMGPDLRAGADRQAHHGARPQLRRRPGQRPDAAGRVHRQRSGDGGGAGRRPGRALLHRPLQGQRRHPDRTGRQRLARPQALTRAA
jgi:hypothetical protein